MFSQYGTFYSHILNNPSLERKSIITAASPQTMIHQSLLLKLRRSQLHQDLHTSGHVTWSFYLESSYHRFSDHRTISGGHHYHRSLPSNDDTLIYITQTKRIPTPLRSPSHQGLRYGVSILRVRTTNFPTIALSLGATVLYTISLWDSSCVYIYMATPRI